MSSQRLKYPMDKDNFAMVSNDWLVDMRRYNMIVVDVASDNLPFLQRCTQGLFDHFGPHVTEDPKTWETTNFPDSTSPFLICAFAESEAAFRARLHPTIVKVCATLYGTTSLMTTIDHYDFKRATVIDGLVRSEYKSAALSLHIDIDPNAYVVQRNKGNILYQAMLAINENSHETGSFVAVPGSANELVEWVRSKNSAADKKVPPYNINQSQRIPLRAGHAVFWDMGMTHANFVGHHSSEPRLTQYVRMVPITEWAIHLEPRCVRAYWEKHQQKRDVVSNMNWTEDERKMLDLPKRKR